MTASDKSKKIIVFGGSGFVGCHVMQQLQAAGANAIAVSRTGTRPAHLQNVAWADRVDWLQGDAVNPDPNLLRDADCAVCLVGSPPVPTFSRAAYDAQLQANGTTNVNVIQMAKEVGVKHVVLLGAKIPGILKTDRFAYFRGKRLALEAARSFSEVDGNTAVVIQPRGLFGTRHTASGTPIPIGLMLGPLAKIFSSQLISVGSVAQRISREALLTTPTEELAHSSFKLITHDNIAI